MLTNVTVSSPPFSPNNSVSVYATNIPGVGISYDAQTPSDTLSENTDTGLHNYSVAMALVKTGPIGTGTLAISQIAIEIRVNPV